MIVSPNTNCPHINNLYPLNEFELVKFESLKCENCEEKNDLWICLSCSKAFCGRYLNKHFFQHFKENNGHCIGISTLDLSVWCYNCSTPGYNDPGNYIDSPITNQYVNIYSNYKFKDNNNNLVEINNSVGSINANKIKYENFIELLKNNKLNNGICIIGSQIYENKNNINEFKTYNKVLINELCEKNKIDQNDLFTKKLFKTKPEILYEYLKCLYMDIEPNKIHQLIKILVDKNIIQNILTENIDNNENKIGVPKEKIIYVSGNLYECSCIECHKEFDIKELEECIKKGEVKKCDKCNNFCKPNIILNDDEIDKEICQKFKNIENFDFCLIIGSNLDKEPVSLISNILDKNKNSWIIVIKDDKEIKYSFDFGNVYNRHIYLEKNYIENILNLIIDDKKDNLNKNNLMDNDNDNLKENNLKNEDKNNLIDADKDNLKENNLKNEDKNNLIDADKDNLKENNLKNEDKNNLKDEKKDNIKENYFDDPNLYLEKEISYKKLSNGTITSNFLNKLQLNYESFSFNNYSIFNTNSEKIKKDKEYIQNLLTNYIKTNKMETSLNKLENGALGTMLGMGIADSMGHRFEFQPLRYNTITLRDMGEGQGGSFRLLPGQWTDDTSMGLCLADSLIVKNGEYDAHDLMHRFLCWWYGGYNNAFRFDKYRNHSCGLGGMISESFEYYIESPKEKTEAGDKNSSGIGSIMRNAAVPICFHNDLNKAMKIAELQSYATHHGDEAAECCRLLTFIVIKIFNRKNETLQEIIENLNDFKTPVFSVQCLAQSKEENDSPDRDWNWKKKDFKYSPTRARSQPGYIGSYAMDGMAMALHVVYYTNSFEEAVIKVVNLRGDSDSVGAVVGQIAGAYYGVDHIPPKWIEVISEWDHFEIPLRGYILSKINKY